MRARILPLALTGVSLFLASCNPLLTGSLPSGMTSSALVQHVPYSGTFNYSVDPQGIARDVYFVFTNPSLSQDAATVPTVSGSISVNGKSIPAPAAMPLASSNSAPLTLQDRISEFNRNPKAFLPAPSFMAPSPSLVSSLPAQNDVASTNNTLATAGTFYTDLNPDGTGAAPVSAHCRALNTGSSESGGTRTVSVWVDDNVYVGGSTQDFATISQIQAVADKFLASSASDIYHWDTSVVGEPWGPQNDGSLIHWDPNNTVTILLTRLNGTNYPPAGSVLVGFFWAKDNFTTAALPGSNQRIMFYIDSWMAANDPNTVYSTLAHEFQHMIQFYQKQALRGATTGTDTWINEMCSMLMEDLVAFNLGVPGPRGTTAADGTPTNNTNGRFPLFNQSSNSSLAVTAGGSSFGVTQYSVAYAFGSWLIRNFGGPVLLNRIVQCPQTDYTAVVNAASAFSGRTETMQGLLQQWAASVLISKDTGAPFGYRYNTGGWTSFSYGSQTFNLGSINVFNYSPTLTVYGPSSPIPAGPYYSSNVYYEAATALTSATNFTISLPAGTSMTVVLR